MDPLPRVVDIYWTVEGAWVFETFNNKAEALECADRYNKDNSDLCFIIEHRATLIQGELNDIDE